MHKLIADPQIAQVRKRASEGDCPITPSLSVESLEDLVLHLADAKKVADRAPDDAPVTVFMADCRSALAALPPTEEKPNG